jgi:hypothetical protein
MYLLVKPWNVLNAIAEVVNFFLFPCKVTKPTMVIRESDWAHSADITIRVEAGGLVQCC